MIIEVDRKDLEAMVKGTCPSYDVMNRPLIAANGSYVGGFVDDWKWSLKFNTEEELFEMYKVCKNSWK